jgi:hypothetical protein
MDISNPCFRCGKQRIVVSTKKERLAGSWVTTTVTSCPDPECQKILNKQMEKERVARETLVGLNKLPVNSFGRKRKDIILKKRVSVL